MQASLIQAPPETPSRGHFLVFVSQALRIPPRKSSSLNSCNPVNKAVLTGTFTPDVENLCKSHCSEITDGGTVGGVVAMDTMAMGVAQKSPRS